VANGKGGDDPLIDILTWNLPVFTPGIDDSIRQISERGGFESPLAIEYVRQMPTLLAWLNEVERLSGRDLADVRSQYLDQFQETLQRALGQRSSLERIVDTASGRTYSRDELLASLRTLDADTVRTAESSRGPLEDWDVYDLMSLYREVDALPDDRSDPRRIPPG
jgi:hypothetical protein